MGSEVRHVMALVCGLRFEVGALSADGYWQVCISRDLTSEV